MKNLSKLFVLPALLFSHAAIAQGAEMADVMRSNGKIYVVVAIIMAIFTGLIVYLVAMDRKITRLEKKLPSK
jgi:CcmD family protein